MNDDNDISLYFRIDKEGNIHEFAISLLEDMWHDYLYFMEQANHYKDGKSDFLTRRYLRVSLLTLIVYAEAVINRWCHIIKTKQNEPPEKIKEFIRYKPLLAKSKYVTEEVIKIDPSVKGLQLFSVKELRNEMVHFKPGNDLRIFVGISMEVVKAAEQELTDWMGTIEASMHLNRHPNTEEALDDFDEIGSVLFQDYTK